MENSFIPKYIIDYCVIHSTELPFKSSEILLESLKLENGHMLIGILSANFLRSLILIKKPKNILEIGTFTGFSLSIFNEYSNGNVKITSLEEDKNTYLKTKSKFQSEISDGCLSIINEEGVSFLSNNETTFDFIFIDARKETYFNKIDLLYEKLESGGVLLIDNALAGLSVFNPKKLWEFQTVDFNKQIAEDSRFTTMILPIRDGFTISIKNDFT